MRAATLPTGAYYGHTTSMENLDTTISSHYSESEFFIKFKIQERVQDHDGKYSLKKAKPEDENALTKPIS